jgi:hypothetical protein
VSQQIDEHTGMGTALTRENPGDYTAVEMLRSPCSCNEGNSGHILNTVTCMSDSRRGFGLDIGFLDHLQVVTTNNYTTNAGFHTLPITPH